MIFGSKKKTLLLLGGSRQQTVAIEAAKRCGYATVLCDYLPDNPGRLHADAFHLTSTTDRDAVLEVARSERVDGVIAYSSDPASPTAAYVAEKLCLPTNPLRAVETMSTKNLFRDHMRATGLPCPKSASFDAGIGIDDLADLVEGVGYPVVMKPTDSSGSKGVSVALSADGIGMALDRARAASRNGVLIAEQHIEKAFPHVIGGDVFVLDGCIVFWGLMSCLRSSASSLIPIGKKTPSGLNRRQLQAVKAVLQRLVASLGIRFGELNVEVIVGRGDVPYVLELGSRAGGNMIPVQLSDVSGADLVEANVRCAMGEDPGPIECDCDSGGAFSAYVLHSLEDGVFERVLFSDEIGRHVYRSVLYARPGDRVKRFDDASKALGIVFLRFDSADQMDEMLLNVDTHIKVVLR